PPHEADRLAVPFGERPVHRVLEHPRVPVVVLGSEHDEAVRPVDRAAEARDLVVRVVAAAADRRDPLEPWERMVAEIDRLDLEVVAGGQAFDDPVRDRLAETTLAGGPGDHLDEHGVSEPRLAARMFPRRAY